MRLIDADRFKETLDYYIREAGWSDAHNEALRWVKDEFLDSEPTAEYKVIQPIESNVQPDELFRRVMRNEEMVRKHG